MTPEERVAEAFDKDPWFSILPRTTMARLIRDAVQEEREACCRAVRACIDGYDGPDTRAAILFAEHAIRARNAEGPNSGSPGAPGTHVQAQLTQARDPS